jgi:pimeloyl-ACP methyl ester carboxylesterase
MDRAYRRVAAGGRLADTFCGPIQYAGFGEGAPVLVVHGAGGGYDQGEYLARLTGGNYHWIAPSRFGFLGSPVPEGADSALQAGAYAGLLDALGIDRVGVVGVSMGGPSSLMFALQYPERTTSLVLVSAASHALPARPAILATMFDAFVNDFVFWSILRLSPKSLLVALGVPPQVQAGLSAGEVARMRAFLNLIEPMAARRHGQKLEQHMSEIDVQALCSIQVPVLALHARDDTLVPYEQAEFAAREIPGAQLEVMEEGGHLAFMMDANTKARERVLSFLARYNEG